MEYLEFQQKWKEHGFHIHENEAIGVYKDYPISITRYFTGTLEICCYLEEEAWDKIRQQMEHSVELRQAALVYDEHRMIWKMRNCEYGGALSALNEIVEVLRENKVTVSNRCAICGEEDADAHAMLHGANRPIHRNCIQGKLVNTRQEIDGKKRRWGLLGALAGCAIGGLPALWAFLFLGQTYAVLFLFLPFCIYYGYKGCKGKMDQTVVIITIILSVFAVFAMEIMYLVNYNIEEQFLPNTMLWHWRMFIKVFQIDGLFFYLLKSASLKLLFVAVGIVIEWEVISKNVKQMERSVEEILETIN